MFLYYIHDLLRPAADFFLILSFQHHP